MPEEQNILKLPSKGETTCDPNLQDSAISSSDTQPPNMEVHHHPDLHHKRKHFREYVLEFFMIFLAVTMGFFAESIREHFVEVRNTRQYLETFKQELINNKKAFVIADSVYSSVVPSLDSVISVFFDRTENQDLHLMGRLLKHVKRVFNTSIDNAAYQQMVNSGGLKNLDNLALRDSISTYVGQIETFETYNSLVYNRIGNALPEIMKLEDLHDFRIKESDTDYVPEIMPYPELTEGERRLMIYYYANHRGQLSSDVIMIEKLIHSNEHLMKMINKILDN
jgi:hypothetical protein